ncbi:hypothetical protein ACJX0J_024162, partial [Zea mays]
LLIKKKLLLFLSKVLFTFEHLYKFDFLNVLFLFFEFSVDGKEFWIGKLSKVSFHFTFTNEGNNLVLPVLDIPNVFLSLGINNMFMVIIYCGPDFLCIRLYFFPYVYYTTIGMNLLFVSRAFADAFLPALDIIFPVMGMNVRGQMKKMKTPKV